MEEKVSAGPHSFSLPSAGDGSCGAAYAANPARFRRRRPEPPKLLTVAWINDPNEEVTQKAS